MKAGQTKKLTFNALRTGIGSGMGVIYDVDVEITRNCRVVIGSNGMPRWQIIKSCINQSEWDYFVDSDQECLNDFFDWL